LTSAILTVTDLFDHMRAEVHGTTFEVSGHDRTVLVDRVGDVHVALFLTVRDHRRWMEMHRKGGKIVLEAKEVEAGKHPVDVNFLAIDAKTGRGLYRAYRGAMNIPTLGRTIARSHNALVKKRRQAWIDAAVANEEGKTKAAKAAAKSMPFDIVVAQMILTEDLPALLNRLTHVESFQVDLEGISDKAPEFQPLSSSVEATRYKLKFKRHLQAKTIVHRILNFLKKEKPKKGQINGHEDGERRSYDISEIPATVFGEEDYSTSVLTFEPEQFVRAPPTRAMLRTMSNHPTVFSAKEA